MRRQPGPQCIRGRGVRLAARSRRRTARRAPAVGTAGAARPAPANRREAAAAAGSRRSPRRDTGSRTSASIARSVSRWPPCAAGSMSTTPSGVHITLPLHRSPCSRAGGSSSSKSPASQRDMTASMTPRAAASSRGAASSAIGAKTFAGIEGAPPVVFLERHRQWIVQRPEVPRPSPTVGRRAESVGTSVVGACQSATEFMRGRARRSGRNQPLQRQADVVVLDHPRTWHSVLSG